jgi:hypothetical protein
MTTLELSEGKNRGTGRLKVRSEGICGQTRGYTLEEIAGIEFDTSVPEYCDMEEWEPENILDIAFISKRENARLSRCVQTFASRGIIYDKTEFEPFLVMREKIKGHELSVFHWKGAFYHSASGTIWFFMGFLPEPDVELSADKKVYHAIASPYRVLKNCPMQASKKFWMTLIQRARGM